MKRLFALLIALQASVALGVPLSTIGSFCSLFPFECQRGTESLLAARGTGTNAYYVLEVDPTTGALPVNVTGGSISATFASVGPTGSAVPAQADYTGLNNGGTLIGAIGDSSGRTVVAGAGAAGTPAGGVVSVQGVSGGTAVPVSIAANIPAEQTSLTAGSLNADLVASTDVSLYKWYSLQIAGTWSGTITFQGSNDNSNFVSIIVVSSSSTTNISSSTTSNGIYTGPANYKYLRVRMTAYTSGTATGTLELYPAGSALNIIGALATQNGTWNVGLSTGTNVVGRVGIDQTTPGTTNAVAVTNLPTTVDTNTGAAGASTLRVVTATRSESVTTPLAAQLSNGSAAIAYGSGASGSTVLRVVAATDSNPGSGRTFADSVRYAYSSGAVSTVSWVQLIASTAATINCLNLFDSSGQTLELGTGAAASETRVLIIPPGGLDGCVPLKIASGTRVAIRALSATTGAIGEIDITGFQ